MGEDSCFSLKTRYHLIILHEAREPPRYWYLWRVPQALVSLAGVGGMAAISEPTLCGSQGRLVFDKLITLLSPGSGRTRPFAILLGSCYIQLLQDYNHSGVSHN